MPAGSGLHDLDAPLPSAPEMSGAMLIPANTYGDRAPFGSVGAESAQRADRGSARGAILPSFGPHGCVKPYCCLFVYIGFLLRSDGRCQTERKSVSGLERTELAESLNSPTLGTPFSTLRLGLLLYSRGHRQGAT